MRAAVLHQLRRAFGSLRRGSRLVRVGLQARNEVPRPVLEPVVGGPTVPGSIVRTHLLRGTVPARLVFDLNPA
jgi:hypothetical protein